MKISQKIQALRREKDMTQAQIAKIAGVSDKAISAWESQKRAPKLNAIQNICTFFDFDLNTFIDETADEFTSGKKEPAASSEFLSPEKQQLLSLVDTLSDEQCRRLAGIIEEAKKLL